MRDYRTGDVLFEMNDLEFPVGYSQNAVDIIASRYFRRTGVPRTGHEISLRQPVHRMVDFWVAALVEEGLVTAGVQTQILYDEPAFMILDQRFAPNSPQWFNTGLARAYGIAGEPQGMCYVARRPEKSPSPPTSTVARRLRPASSFPSATRCWASTSYPTST